VFERSQFPAPLSESAQGCAEATAHSSEVAVMANKEAEKSKVVPVVRFRIENDYYEAFSSLVTVYGSS
jgi:hypothetical protein